MCIARNVRLHYVDAIVIFSFCIFIFYTPNAIFILTFGGRGGSLEIIIGRTRACCFMCFFVLSYSILYYIVSVYDDVFQRTFPSAQHPIGNSKTAGGTLRNSIFDIFPVYITTNYTYRRALHNLQNAPGITT